MEKIENEELVRRYQIGDQEALLMLWEQNKGLMHRAVSPYKATAELDDLMQEAFIGLTTAAREYKPEAGAKFSGFVCDHIRWEILSYLESSGNAVRLPRGCAAQMRQVEKIRAQLREKLGRDPEEKELAREMGLSLDRIRFLEIAKARRSQISTDAPVSSEDGAATIGDSLADPVDHIAELEEDLNREELKRVLWESVDALPDLQSNVIRQAFQRGLTNEEMAALFHLPESSIRSARSCAIKRLQSYKIRNKLAPYWSGEMESKVIQRSGYQFWKNTGMSCAEWAVIKQEEQDEEKLSGYTVREVKRKVLDQYKILLGKAKASGDQELIQRIEDKIAEYWEECKLI